MSSGESLCMTLATKSVVLKACLGTAVAADNRFIIVVLLRKRGVPRLKSHVYFYFALVSNNIRAETVTFIEQFLKPFMREVYLTLLGTGLCGEEALSGYQLNSHSETQLIASIFGRSVGSASGTEIYKCLICILLGQ